MCCEQYKGWYNKLKIKGKQGYSYSQLHGVLNNLTNLTKHLTMKIIC